MDAKKLELVGLRSVLLRVFFFLSFFDPSSWLFISLSLPSLAGLFYLPRQPFSPSLLVHGFFPFFFSFS